MRLPCFVRDRNRVHVPAERQHQMRRLSRPRSQRISIGNLMRFLFAFLTGGAGSRMPVERGRSHQVVAIAAAPTPVGSEARGVSLDPSKRKTAIAASPISCTRT